MFHCHKTGDPVMMSINPQSLWRLPRGHDDAALTVTWSPEPVRLATVSFPLFPPPLELLEHLGPEVLH